MIKVGCCGLPKGLPNYSKLFELVELQTTFYNLPERKTAERWRRAVSPNFEFSVKAWQLFTHPPSSPTYGKLKMRIDASKMDSYGFFRPTKEVFETWTRFAEVCNVLESKHIVFQTPASFDQDETNIENLKEFMSGIDRKEFSVVWEARGNWKREVMKELCRELKLIHCTDPFSSTPVTEGEAYFRLHGRPPGKKMYYHRYTKEELESLLAKCRRYKEVYCMFNNVYMWDNAVEFKKLLG